MRDGHLETFHFRPSRQERAKRLILLSLQVPLFYFFYFQPKKRMSSPQTG